MRYAILLGWDVNARNKPRTGLVKSDDLVEMHAQLCDRQIFENRSVHAEKIAVPGFEVWPTRTTGVQLR
ncbi:hypothetical protein BHMPCIPO_06469 [Ensifer sesbaniae]|nr:hypothetical protein [Ensifer sesbaniae]